MSILYVMINNRKYNHDWIKFNLVFYEHIISTPKPILHISVLDISNMCNCRTGKGNTVSIFIIQRLAFGGLNCVYSNRGLILIQP